MIEIDLSEKDNVVHFAPRAKMRDKAKARRAFPIRTGTTTENTSLIIVDLGASTSRRGCRWAANLQPNERAFELNETEFDELLDQLRDARWRLRRAQPYRPDADVAVALHYIRRNPGCTRGEVLGAVNAAIARDECPPWHRSVVHGQAWLDRALCELRSHRLITYEYGVPRSIRPAPFEVVGSRQPAPECRATESSRANAQGEPDYGSTGYSLHRFQCGTAALFSLPVPRGRMLRRIRVSCPTCHPKRRHSPGVKLVRVTVKPGASP